MVHIILYNLNDKVVRDFTDDLAQLSHFSEEEANTQ